MLFWVKKKFSGLPWIEVLIFIAIALFSIGYVTQTSDFAEQHLTVSFLNFPIFIGEILLCGCLVMFVLLLKQKAIIVKPWHYWLFAYIFWILIKVFFGYWTFGPLAFRNAALFYYPFFILISYYSFRRIVFSQKTLTVIFFPLAVIMGLNRVNDYYLWGYMTILFLVSFYSGQRWIRWGGVVLILWHLYRHQFLLVGSRSHMVGQFAAVLFLAFFMGTIFIPQRTRCWLGPLIGLGVLGLVALGLWKWSDPNALQSMFNIGKLKGRYEAFDAEIEQKKAYFKSEELQVQLYHSNTVGAVGVSADKMEAFRKALSDQIVAALVDYSEKVSAHTRMTLKKDIDSIVEKAEMSINERQKELLGQAQSSIEWFAKESLANVSSILLRIEQVDINDFKLDLFRKGGLALADFKETLQKGTKLEIPVTVTENTQMTSYERQVMLEREAVALPTVQQAQAEIKMKMDNLSSKTEQTVQKTVTKLKCDEEAKLPSRELQIDNSIKKGNYLDQASVNTMVRSRSLETAENNIFFRIFIWRDMIREMLQKEAFLGISFGQPQRSQSLEILSWAAIEWRRDGWITPHNSYLHMIYRAGVIGVFLVLALLGLFVYLVRAFLITKSWEGGLLLSAIVYWIVIANFLVFLELPYNAIPFWSFVGATVVFANRKLAENRSAKKGS